MPQNLTPSEEAIRDLEEHVGSLLARVDALEGRLPVVNYAHRNLNEVFVVAALRPALVFYTVELTVTLASSGTHTDSATVTLLIDGVSTTSTARNEVTATLLLGSAITLTYQQVLIGFATAGSTVEMVTSGTGTVTLVQSVEALM